MEIGFIGLGKMGSLMVKRLLAAGHRVVGYNLEPQHTQELITDGLIDTYSVSELIAALESNRKVVWLMVPPGKPVQELLFGDEGLYELLEPNDIIIDGGNSYYKDSLNTAELLKKHSLHFVDVGTSGGLQGAEAGACLMVGGSLEVCSYLEPMFNSLALPSGYARVGEVGAGHFAKMVHNGIEYAFVQALGEGFALLEKSKFDFDLAQVAQVWNTGSVIRSWVVELAAQAFKNDPKLEHIGDKIGGGSTGEWALQTSIEEKVPVPTIYAALAARYVSQLDESFSAKVIAALRNEWGGHEVEKK